MENKKNSMLDGNTGLIKEDFFYYLAEFEVKRSMRYQNFSTLLLLESDQGFNNGVDLKIFAQILKEEFRDTDIIGRINHIRFGIILPYSNMESSLVAAERVRDRIENYIFTERERQTISIGGAIIPTNASNREELISLAEHMLKMAKQKGGNNFYLP